MRGEWLKREVSKEEIFRAIGEKRREGGLRSSKRREERGHR